MCEEMEYCEGKLCRDRETCLRFTEGKKHQWGWFSERLRADDYGQCEFKVEL